MDKKRAKSKSQLKTNKTLTSKQLEQALHHVLTSTLALYVLNKSSKPISRVINDLTDIQFNAAQLIGLLLNLQKNKMSRIDLDNTLTGIFSFIPFSDREDPQKFKKISADSDTNI